jgi:hypothetical protein
LLYCPAALTIYPLALTEAHISLLSTTRGVGGVGGVDRDVIAVEVEVEVEVAVHNPTCSLSSRPAFTELRALATLALVREAKLERANWSGSWVDWGEEALLLLLLLPLLIPLPLPLLLLLPLLPFLPPLLVLPGTPKVALASSKVLRACWKHKFAPAAMLPNCTAPSSPPPPPSLSLLALPVALRKSAYLGYKRV